MTLQIEMPPTLEPDEPGDEHIASGALTPPPLMAPVPSQTRPASEARDAALEVSNLNVYYGPFRAIRDVGLSINRHAVTAIIGPSGCGKSTFLRTLNRMHELTPM